MARRKIPNDLREQEKRLAKLAKEGSIQEFAEALLEHPVDGKLLRAFAAEDQAPEHAKFLERIQALKAKILGDRHEGH
jgi:hypothetical protein